MAQQLTEKYRPRTLSDLVGQDEVLLQLREFLAEPESIAFIFAGSTGVGKTSAAMAFAAELGCDVDQPCGVGGMMEITSGDHTIDNLREVLRGLWARPMFGNGWKLLIVSEADRMSAGVEYLWLDALETLPPRTVVVFTTNHPEKFARKFRTRCKMIRFESDPAAMRQAAQRLVDEVWFAETGRTDAPLLDDLEDAIDGDELSIRAAIQSLDTLAKRARRAPKPAPVIQTRPAIQSVTVEHAGGTLAPLKVMSRATVASLTDSARELADVSGDDMITAFGAILTGLGFRMISQSYVGGTQCWTDDDGVMVNLISGDDPQLTTLDDGQDEASTVRHENPSHPRQAGGKPGRKTGRRRATKRTMMTT